MRGISVRPSAIFFSGSDGSFVVLDVELSEAVDDGVMEEDDGAVSETLTMLFYDFFLKKMRISLQF